MKKKIEEHECRENMELDGGRDAERDNTCLYEYGECTVCGKKMREVFEYVETEVLES